MDEIQKFVADARAKGMDDQQIKDLLRSNGWSEAQMVAALGGLIVPPPPAVSGHKNTATAAPAMARPSISALQAALQHVLLWVFTFTSSIMIGVVAAALFGAGSGSSEPLITYVVLEVVTFVPFALFFWRYLRQLNREPDMTTGKVWSIITIVLHSIGLIGAAISFVLFIVLTHDSYTTAGLAGSAAIAVMDALVVTAYVLANFTKLPVPSFQPKFLNVFPILLFVLIAVFGMMALLRVGSVKADDQARQNLVTATERIHSYVASNKMLPAGQNKVSGIPAGVTYSRISSSTYELCASFRREYPNASDYYVYADSNIDDTYVSTYMFENKETGKNCWTLRNSELTRQPAYIDSTTSGSLRPVTQ